MKKDLSWKDLIQTELEGARLARENGNQGKARVCARRAAGIAIAEYLERQNLPNPGSSAYDRLQFIASYPGVTPRAREISQHLIVRVTEEFNLPIDVDIIAETTELIQLLLDVTFPVE
jgi:hypothetical protein